MNKDVLAFAKDVKMRVGGGADGKGRNSKDAFIERDGQVMGSYQLAQFWQPVGRTVSSISTHRAVF